MGVGGPTLPAPGVPIRSKEITAADTAATFNPPPPSNRSTGIGSAGKPPRRGGVLGFLGRLLRVRIIIGIAVLAIGGIASLFVNSDSISVSSLDPGDCFETPEDWGTTSGSSTRISRVTKQDCALPHDAEVIAIVTGLEDEAIEKCFEELAALDLETFESLPDDFGLSMIGKTFRHRCIIDSPSGQLTGSIVD